jgi:hypothetical protein
MRHHLTCTPPAPSSEYEQAFSEHYQPKLSRCYTGRAADARGSARRSSNRSAELARLQVSESEESCEAFRRNAWRLLMMPQSRWEATSWAGLWALDRSERSSVSTHSVASCGFPSSGVLPGSHEEPVTETRAVPGSRAGAVRLRGYSQLLSMTPPRSRSR